MYKVVYTKTAAKDVPKLKSAHLDEKAKALIEICLLYTSDGADHGVFR